VIPLSPALLLSALATLAGLTETAASYSLATVDFPVGLKPKIAPPLREPIPSPLAPGGAWQDASLFSAVGFWSHQDLHSGISAWPLPAAVTRDMVVAFAHRHSVFASAPRAGDLFVAVTDPRLPVCGVIAMDPEPSPYADAGDEAVMCATFEARAVVEGDYDDLRKPRRWCVVRRKRVFQPTLGDVFVRWADMDGRA